MGSRLKRLLVGIVTLLIGGFFLFQVLSHVWNELDFRLNGVQTNGIVTDYVRRCATVQYQTVTKNEAFEERVVSCQTESAKLSKGSPVRLVYSKDNPAKVAVEGDYSIGFFPIFLTLLGSLICLVVSWYSFFFRSPNS